MELFIEYNIKNIYNVDCSNFIDAYKKINNELWHLYGLNQLTKEELRIQRFSKTFIHFHIDNNLLMRQLAEKYISITPYKTHLIKDAIEILNYLKCHYNLHIITNGFKDVQYIKLNSCKLHSFFEQIIVSEEHGFKKPDPRIFKRAQEITYSNENECLMIGDTYETDVEGAIKANWKGIHLSPLRNETKHRNYFHIKNLLELKELL